MKRRESVLSGQILCWRSGGQILELKVEADVHPEQVDHQRHQEQGQTLGVQGKDHDCLKLGKTFELEYGFSLHLPHDPLSLSQDKTPGKKTNIASARNMSKLAGATFLRTMYVYTLCLVLEN